MILLDFVRFDEAAARQFDDLRRHKLRVGSSDLRVAAMALANVALLCPPTEPISKERPGLVELAGLTDLRSGKECEASRVPVFASLEKQLRSHPPHGFIACSERGAGRRLTNTLSDCPNRDGVGSWNASASRAGTLLVDQLLAVGNAVVEIDAQGRDGCPANRSAAHKAWAVPAEVTVPLVAPRIEQ